MSSETCFMDRASAEFLPQVRFPPIKDTSSSSRPRDAPWTVILTGSTGSLGIHIVTTLHRMPPDKVRRVYCLNRSDDAAAKHSAQFAQRGIPDFQDDRFVFLKANFLAPMLGLDPATYHQLLNEVTVTIHNAWTVNFVLPGEEFRPNLVGLRNLLHFSYESPLHPPLLFVSSLGIAYSSDKQLIQETIYHDCDTIGDGYSQSKYVGEHMLEAYTLSTGLPAAVLRVGQIAGPVTCGGIWPVREWFPTMLRASMRLGALPRALGPQNLIDWIPVDILSQVIVEIVEHVTERLPDRKNLPPVVYNVINPATVPFSALAPYFADRIAVRTVPGLEWARLLELRAARQPIPGAKLLGFYRRVLNPEPPLIVTVTDNFTAASRTARNFRPVNEEWVRRWLDQWGYHTAPQSNPIAARL